MKKNRKTKKNNESNVQTKPVLKDIFKKRLLIAFLIATAIISLGYYVAVIIYRRHVLDYAIQFTDHTCEDLESQFQERMNPYRDYFFDKSENFADIADSVRYIFHYGVINKHNLTNQYDEWHKILKDCGDPVETLEIMETYWARKIPEPTVSRKSDATKKLIQDIAERDINVEDAERRWQIIKANLVAYKEKQEEIRQLLNMPNPPTPPPPPPQKKMLSKRLKDWLKDKFNFKPRAKIKLE